MTVVVNINTVQVSFPFAFAKVAWVLLNFCAVIIIIKYIYLLEYRSYKFGIIHKEPS